MIRTLSYGREIEKLDLLITSLNEQKRKLACKLNALSLEASPASDRELISLDDEVIRKHLLGTHVIGIYPMLQDETCHFLAADFDGEDWIDNVFTFKKTCVEEGVPIAIERSRSGNGAHAWIFFKDNIPASLARRMGSFLITKTMSQRYQLDMNRNKSCPCTGGKEYKKYYERQRNGIMGNLLRVL